MEWNSRRFEKMLFKRFPLWKPYAGHYDATEEGLLVYYLEVKVPSENPSVLEPLVIRTLPNEVLVSWFGGWHFHCQPSMRDAGHDYMDQAIVSIAEIVSDDYVVGVHYGPSGQPGWGFACMTASFDLERYVRNITCVLRIRSWRGSHDRDVMPDL